MTWRRVFGQEPSRSRFLIVAGGVLSATGVAALIWASRTRSLWLFTAVSVTWLALLLAICVVVVSVTIREMGNGVLHARPMRFVLTNRGFGVAPLLSPGLTAMPLMLVNGLSLAVLVPWWRDIDHRDPAVSTLSTVFIGVRRPWSG